MDHDFNFVLPTKRIAQHALVRRDHARMLVVKSNRLEHRYFYDILSYLQKGDVLVINDTKVSRARIKGNKSTGGKAELVLCGLVDKNTFRCRIKSRNVKVGNIYRFSGLTGKVIGKEDDIFTVSFDHPLTEKVRERLFEVPTPPYITQPLRDESEYQTVYAKKEGSLAAPTAGLHFTQSLLEKIRGKGVGIARICLHIDYGTFLPVRVPLVRMHEESYEVSKDAADLINSRKGKLYCVGTTSVRALESAADSKGRISPNKARTDIFIYPGYKWKNRIDGLITNFHLPKSTLLMLVSAYIGKECILHAYREAVDKKYRFYSLGDATLLLNDA